MTTTSISAAPQAAPTGATRAYRALILLFWVGVLAQAFFAGAGIFAGGDWMRAHIIIGHLLTSPLPLLPLLVVIVSYAGKLSRAEKSAAWQLFLLAFLQPFWLYLRGIHPLLAALHPVNALLLFALPLYMLTRTPRG